VSEETVRVVRAAIAASARGDSEAFMSALDPAIEWTPVKADPDYAVHRGLDDVAVWLGGWSEVFPDMRWELERIIDAGDETVVALVQMRGRGDATGADVGTQTYGVIFTVRLGMIVRIEEADIKTALRAAGLEG
jgi:ketosteroid isomerase-like protein